MSNVDRNKPILYDRAEDNPLVKVDEAIHLLKTAAESGEWRAKFLIDLVRKEAKLCRPINGLRQFRATFLLAELSIVSGISDRCYEKVFSHLDKPKRSRKNRLIKINTHSR